MKNQVLILCLLISLSVLINGEKEYFKVPLEIRETNRPERLVDNVDDPEMIKMKSIQDKFFGIVSNSSAGQDFKNFNQLLHLLDSKAGLELGRLALNGIMIGIGKDNSVELFSEFLDDFKYRVSPDLADALVDYKDFMKSVDLKLIPLTLQTLFRKDELGNSLAQLPLGQLVDLIQPEASKYGIDIRNMINGIVGKGDRTFPEMVRKVLKNFNASNILKGLAGSMMDDEEMLPTDIESTGNEVHRRTKRENRDSTLMLFKPMIAKLLKDYDIDLDTDAVIQVMTPFVSGWGEVLQNMFASKTGEGGDFNIAQLAPLLGLLSSQGSNGKNDVVNMMQAAMSLMGNIVDQDGDMAPLLSLASQVLGGQKPKPSKETKENQKSKDGLDLDGIARIFNQLTGGGGQGMDMGNILKMASSLMGDKNGGKGLDAGTMLEMASTLMGDKDGGPDAGKLLKLASNLVGNFAAKDKKQEKTKKINGLFEALAPFLMKMQKDKKIESKLRDAITFAKLTIGPKLFNIEEIKNSLTSLIAANLKGGMNVNIDSLNTAFSFTREDWFLFFNELENDDFRALLIQNTVIPASDIVEMFASDDYQQQQGAKFEEKLKEGLTMLGMHGVDLNVPSILDKLKPAMDMMTAGWNLPVKMTSLVDPIKRSWKETAKWYFASVKSFKNMSKKELQAFIAQALESDFAQPILEVSKIAANSETSSRCIAREVCELVNDVAYTHPDSAKLLITRMSSIIYGGIRSEVESNYNTIVDVMKAASMGSHCEKYFPVVCPIAIPSKSDESSTESNEKIDSGHTEL